MAESPVQSARGVRPLKPKASSDDQVMRLFVLVIGLYLVVSLALPLYAMFSKSCLLYTSDAADE